jgi:hypothetical protein
MSTDLAVIKRDTYMALRDDSDVREAMAANLASGERVDVTDLIMIPTPLGGVTTWSWEGIHGEQSSKDITGLLVCIQIRGVLWPSADPEGNKTPPLLVSDDLQTARQVGEEYGDIDPQELARYRRDDDTYVWDELPWTQWGTGKNGIGKRAKEQRLLFVLQPEAAWPVVITIGPGSLKRVTSWIKKLTVPHYRCVVSLTLEKVANKSGIEYSQIVPQMVGQLSREDGLLVKEQYTDPLKKVSHTVSVASENGGEA